MVAKRDLIRKSRLDRSEDMLGVCMKHIQELEKNAARQGQALEYLFGVLERRTLKGRWRRLVRWLA